MLTRVPGIGFSSGFSRPASRGLAFHAKEAGVSPVSWHTSYMSGPRKDFPALNPLVVLAAVILILYFARSVLIPLALALTLTFLLAPMVAWFQKLPMRRVPAVALVMIISLAGLSGMGWVVAKQLLEVANDLPKYRLNIHKKIEALHAPEDNAFSRATESVKEIGREFSDSGIGPAMPPTDLSGHPSPIQATAQTARPVPVQVITVPANALQYLRDVLGPALRPLGTAGMVVIFTVFILIKQEDLRNRLLRLAGLARLNAMTLALNDAGRRISRYLVMQFRVNACYGICFGLGLFVIGIPNAVLWGVMAGMLRLVPYVGVVTATAFPFALALAVFNGWGPPALVILLFVVLELITGNIVEPWLYGAHTGISSLALLVTTVFWTLLWGWAGLVLAVPLTVCAIVLGRYVPRLSFLHVLLGDETALSVGAQFYQRLLALDQEDARTIATTFLKTNSLVTLYDEVMVPALTLAEQDRHKGGLEETRESFLFLSVSEIVSELTPYRIEEAPPKSRRIKIRSRWKATVPQLPASNSDPSPSSIRVFCLAANDQADEITSSMLAQLLERAGHGVLSLPVGSNIEEILAYVPPEPQDVICISALPPFAFAQAHALCQRVRLRLPEIKILAGIWGYVGDIDKAKERFGSTQPDSVVAELAQAVDQINRWNAEILASESRSALDPA
ncbi:MAG TPA: AI-2E family transporter [Candidatus Angelobacter sp.]|jgi:predicted PurR-regulated permease PerM|nr:AI-2E family transporter [Candidatus Angelobacter sp.]